MARIFMYDGNKLDDPDPSMSTDDIRQFYANVYPELYNAQADEKKSGEDTTITFTKRVGTKGNITVSIDDLFTGLQKILTTRDPARKAEMLDSIAVMAREKAESIRAQLEPKR